MQAFTGSTAFVFPYLVGKGEKGRCVTTSLPLAIGTSCVIYSLSLANPNLMLVFLLASSRSLQMETRTDLRSAKAPVLEVPWLSFMCLISA